jgi:GT2 family glycosyltransferase
MSTPKSSLIICSRNRPQLLQDTVESVLAGTLLPAEIVVVDQSNEMNSVLARRSGTAECDFRYLHEHSVGSGRARNAGIRAARHDLLIFIDDDMYVHSEWLRTLVTSMTAAGPSCVVTGQVLAAQPETEEAAGFAPSTISDSRPALYRGRINTDVLYAGNMGMWRAAVERTGSFDEELGPGTRFRAAEDNDYGFRLLEAGFSIQYVPEAIVYHRCWRSNRDYLPLRWAYGFGQGAFYAKYAGLKDRYMLTRMCRDIGHRALYLPWRCFQNTRRAAGDLVFVAGVLSGAVQWFATRRHA